MVESEYERGVREGEMRARIEEHDRRLDIVNGSIALTGQRLLELTLAVTALTEATTSSAHELARISPVVSTLQRARLVGLRRWHVAVALSAFVVAQATPYVTHLLSH